MIYEDDIVYFQVDGDILYSKYLREKTITREIAEFTVSKRLELMNGKIHKTAIEFTGKVSFTHDAIKVLSSKGRLNLSAAALIFSNNQSRILAKFIIQTFYRNSDFPIKIFKERGDALNWLNVIK